MESRKFDATKSNISDMMIYIQNHCDASKMNENTYASIILQVEDTITTLITHAPKDSKIDISFKKSITKGQKIKISCPGEKFDLIQELINIVSQFDLENTDLGDESRKQIQSFIYKNVKNSIKHKHNKGKNTVDVYMQDTRKRETLITFVSLILGIAVGAIFNIVLPADINNNILKFAFNPINTIFLNAIKLIVIPVVFFSVVTSVASFGSLSDIGKAGIKIIRVYLITSVIAVAIGFIFGIFYDGYDPALSQALTGAGSDHIQTASQTKVSVIDTIVGIVPGNIVEPFLNSNMLAIMFVSILVGIGINSIKKPNSYVVHLFDELNDLFLNLTSMIVKFLPIAIFCSMAIVMMSFTFETLMSLIGLVCVVVIGCLCMLLVYGILILIRTRLNPIPFYKRAFKPWITALSLCSSAATMPVTMEACKQLGISKKLYTFSVPLGCTINMDGVCIQLAITSLFMAKVFGIDLDLNTMINLAVTVLLLSVATPVVPGSCLVVSIIAFTSIGVPAEAISLILGLNIIMESFATAGNVEGDVASTLIVSKHSDSFDKKQYYSNKN